MAKQDNPIKVVGSWNPEGGAGDRRGRVPLIGVLLIILGVLLAAGQLFSAVQLGAAAFFLAVGVVLVAAGLRDRNDLALYVGIFVSALSLADVLSGVGVVHGPGWGTLFLGFALIVVALVRASRGGRLGWAALVGVLLSLWGGAEVAAANLNPNADKLIGPALIVLLGAYLVTRSARSRNP